MTVENFFRLDADGSTISNDNFFGTASSIVLLANHVYEFEYNVWLSKQTAGNIEFSLVSSQTPNNVVAQLVGLNATINELSTISGGIAAGNTTSLPFLQFGIADGVIAAYKITGVYESNVSVNSTLSLTVDNITGTLTPLRGSYYTITELPNENVGIFV